MSDVTRFLEAVERGEPQAAEELLPLVYDELRRLATQMIARERPGQTLQATALVHEAFLRLVDHDRAQYWAGRRHFFGAAAEAMRRILVETARRKGRQKRGGGLRRQEFREDHPLTTSKPDEVLAVHDALDALERTNLAAAELVKLRYFAGFTIQEAAAILEISPRKANQIWAYARAWLLDKLAVDKD